MSAPELELITCATCAGAERDARGRSGGERLLEALQAARAAGVGPALTLSSVRCLWSCARSCAVYLRAPERPGYILCGLAPDDSSARALLEYAELYAQSSDGAVPYKRWPDALRGHFLCRVPALPAAACRRAGDAEPR